MQKIHTVLAAVLLLSSVAVAQPGVKHILLEEFSTAPCGFCPEGDIFAQQIIDDYPAVIWVTHHAGFGTDSMTVPESITIANAFTTFAPGACIDRGDYPIPVYTTPPYIAISRQKWDSVVVAHLNDPPVVDVLMTNNYNDIARTLTCTVDVNFLATPAAGDLRLNLYLMEDSVVGFGSGYDQTNYFNTSVGHPYYNAGNPIVGYVHHHVLRKVVTGAWGLTGVIPSAPVAGNSFTHTFTNIPISLNWKDDDITVIAFVSYYNANTHLRQVINANSTDLKNAGVGIQDIKAGNASVYPNPASGLLHVNFGSTVNDGIVEMINAEGKTVVSFPVKNKANCIIDINTLPQGVYMYKIKADDSVFKIGKLVVMN